MQERRCAICGDPVDPKLRNFCSRHCADVDLQRWLTGNYRILTDEEPDPGEPIPVDPEDSRG